MNKIYKIGIRARKYLDTLERWIKESPNYDGWGMGDRVRDTTFWLDLINKVRVLGEYTKIDREWLQALTDIHWNKTNKRV